MGTLEVQSSPSRQSRYTERDEMHLATAQLDREPVPGVSIGRAENRAWKFFSDSASCAWEIDPQVVEGHLERTTTDRKTAPGVPSWPSRDPIGEEGGLNLYGFVYNDPNGWYDLLGGNPNRLPTGNPDGLPTVVDGGTVMPDGTFVPSGEPAPQPKPKDYNDPERCCDEETINKGREILSKRYKEAVAALKAKGVKPRGHGKRSCKNISGAILTYMDPIPKCWECKEERRRKRVGPFKPDHQYIVCKPIGGDDVDEIAFDYWKGNKDWIHPDSLREEYPIPETPENPVTPDHNTCNESGSWNLEDAMFGIDHIPRTPDPPFKNGVSKFGPLAPF